MTNAQKTPSGKKAIDAVYGAVAQSLSHTTSCKSLKGRVAWLPAALVQVADDGSVELFTRGAPWESEGLKSEYLNRLIKVFRVPDSIVKRARPAPKQHIYCGG